MRNIKFDESSVLTEFAKIAYKEGFIKSASVQEEPVIEKRAGFDPVAIAIYKLKNRSAKLIVKFPRNRRVRTLRFINFRDNKVLPLLLKQLTNAGVEEKDIKKHIDHVTKQSQVFLASLDPKVTPPNNTFMSDRPATDSFMTDLQAPSQSADDSFNKEAKDDSKKYDVTGETGEELVEEAHPGGGTRTELTHSKTDENLVETIVEQQKVDVEVAKSIPKGTYAALATLAGKLDKMGLFDEAGEIDSILKSLNKKIKTANQSSDTYKYMVELELQRVKGKTDQIDKSVMRKNLIREWNNSNFSTVQEGQSILAGLVKRWRGLFPGMDAVYSSNLRHINEDTVPNTTGDKPNIKDVALLPIPLKGGDAGDVVPTNAQKKRIKWKKYYNSALYKITPEARKSNELVALKINYAKSKAFKNAINKVRSSGAKTLKEFVSIMNNSSTGGDIRTLPDIPEPRKGPGLPKSPQQKIMPRYKDIYPQLAALYNNDRRFKSPDLLLKNRPNVQSHLKNTAEALAKQYKNTPTSTPEFLSVWMNQTISALTPEDIRAT